MATPKKKKKADEDPAVAEVQVKKPKATSADEGDASGESGAPPPKIVLKDKHALRDRKAMTTVKCKITLNLRSAGGVMMELRKGQNVSVPAEAVEDLRRSKSIH